MTRSRWMTLIMLSAITIPSVSSAGMSLGANVTAAQFGNANDHSFALSAPSSPLFGIQPGLRIGFPNPSGLDETYFDTGLLMVESYTLWSVTVNYQRALARQPTAPYVTVGGGFQSYGGFVGFEAYPVFGGGFGVRHILGHRQGAIRAELRYDRLHVTEESEDLSSIGLKLGFDLWLQ